MLLSYLQMEDVGCHVFYANDTDNDTNLLLNWNGNLNRFGFVHNK